MTQAVGFKQRNFGRKESAFAALASMAATDAISEAIKITPKLDKKRRQEQSGNGSLQAMDIGLEGGSWSLPSKVRPVAAGTAPDIDPFLEAAFGVKTVNASTSVVYTCDDNPKDSLSIHCLDGNLYQAGFGAIVEQMDVEVAGGGYAMINFSGSFARYAQASNGYTASAALSGQPVVVVSNANAFRPGAYITFAGHAGGYVISSIDYATNTLTLASNLTAAVNNGDAVTCFTVAMTLAGAPLMGVNNQLTIGGTPYPFATAKISMKTGTTMNDKEASSAYASGATEGPREVSLEATMYFNDATVGAIHGKAWQQGTDAVVLRIGADVAGKRCKFSMPVVEWTVEPLEIPAVEVVMAKISGVAKMNSAAGDEIVNIWD